MQNYGENLTPLPSRTYIKLGVLLGATTTEMHRGIICFLEGKPKALK